MSEIQKTSFRKLKQIAENVHQPYIEERCYEKGQVLFEENTASSGLFYIEEGTILLTHLGDTGMDAVVRTAGAEEFIGFFSLIKGTKYTVTARAIEDSTVSFIPKQIFQEAMRETRFANWFVEILCERIVSMQEHVVDLKTKSVRQRLATILLSFENAYAGSANGNGKFISMKKKDIASVVGVAPETLSRRLSEFETEGVIELHTKGIKLLNYGELLHISEISD